VRSFGVVICASLNDHRHSLVAAELNFSRFHFVKETAMSEEPETGVRIESGCNTCALRAKAQQNPSSLIARFWRWHTSWCPGWKAYVKEMESKGLPAPTP